MTLKIRLYSFTIIAFAISISSNCSSYVAGINGKLAYADFPMRCTIHKIPFSKKMCAVQYGLIRSQLPELDSMGVLRIMRYDSLYCAAERDSFPNAMCGDSVLGGCKVYRYGRIINVYYCPSCNIAKTTWIINHKTLLPFPNYSQNENIFGFFRTTGKP